MKRLAACNISIQQESVAARLCFIHLCDPMCRNECTELQEVHVPKPRTHHTHTGINIQGCQCVCVCVWMENQLSISTYVFKSLSQTLTHTHCSPSILAQCCHPLVSSQHCRSPPVNQMFSHSPHLLHHTTIFNVLKQ